MKTYRPRQKDRDIMKTYRDRQEYRDTNIASIVWSLGEDALVDKHCVTCSSGLLLSSLFSDPATTSTDLMALRPQS